MTTDYLTYTEEERQQTIQSLTYEMGSPEEYQVSQLIQVIRGQREEAELPEIQYGWFDLFCHEDDGHSDCYQGTIEGFAAKLLKGGWTVYDLDRNKATCYACANYESPVSEREAWEDEKVYEMRKGEQG